MRAGHVQKMLLLLAALLIGMSLLACGGGGGSPGVTGPVTPPASTGSLAISASGLPAGVNAALRVTGPGNYLQDLTQSQTI